MSCNKHSNWTVLSQSLHSKTQSWPLLLTVVAALCDVLLSLPSCPLCCCLCPIMFVPCFVLVPCGVAAMLCCCLRSLFMGCCGVSPCPKEIYMVIKTSCQCKPTQNTALILSVSKIPYGKNEWWKNYWNNFLV